MPIQTAQQILERPDAATAIGVKVSDPERMSEITDALTAAVPGVSGPGPVLDAPVSSLRWEMLREGIEDYEYLTMLRSLLRSRGDRLSSSVRAEFEALLVVPEAITKDMTTFTKDASSIYEHRAAVARAIERLVKVE